MVAGEDSDDDFKCMTNSQIDLSAIAAMIVFSRTGIVISFPQLRLHKFASSFGPAQKSPQSHHTAPRRNFPMRDMNMTGSKSFFNICSSSSHSEPFFAL